MASWTISFDNPEAHRKVVADGKVKQGQRARIENSDDEDPKILHPLPLGNEKRQRHETDSESKQVFEEGG